MAESQSALPCYYLYIYKNVPSVVLNNNVQKQREQFFIPLCRTLLLYAQWMMYTYIANIFCKIFAVNDMWASVNTSRWCHAQMAGPGWWQQPGRLELFLHWHHWHNHIAQSTRRDNHRDFCIFNFYNNIQFSIILLFHRTDIYLFRKYFVFLRRHTMINAFCVTINWLELMETVYRSGVLPIRIYLSEVRT